MLTEKQVWEIWHRQWELLKSHVKESGHIQPDGEKLPEPWVGFSRAWRQYEGLKPHIVDGAVPEKLLRERAPNQSPEEFEYIKKIFKQTTLPVYLDFENTVGRALHQHNWNIEWIEDDPATLQVKEYVTRGIKEWSSTEAFMRRFMLRLKTLDPMGVVATFPTRIEVIEEETEEGSIFRIDGEAMPRPDLHYFPFSQVWGFEYDKWYLVRAYENSTVTYNNKEVQEGIMCFLIDGENVYRIYQYGKKVDWTFAVELFYPHMIGEAPCHHLGGVPVMVNGHLSFESPYLAAKEGLDLALTNANYLQVSINKCVWPHIVMVGDACDFNDELKGTCFNGELTWPDPETGKQNQVKCPRCHGTGKKRRLSPTGELLIAPTPTADGIGGSDGVNASNALAFISPSTETLTFLEQNVERHIRNSRSILHLDTEAPMAGGDAKTATEAGLNNRAKDAFVKPIADECLRMLQFLISCQGRMIAGREWEGFTLRMPTSYDLRTEADRVAEIAMARENGLPPAWIDQKERDLMGAHYANDPQMTAAMDVILTADRLGRMDKETITAEAAAGRVKAWEILLHYSALDIYHELMDTDKEFPRGTIWERVAKMHELAKVKAPEASASDPMKRLMEVVQPKPPANAA